VGGYAQVSSVSCASTGNCVAGGYYTGSGSRHKTLQGFVATERNGVWGTAIRVPGLAALNKGGYVQVWSVSCGSAGSCAAGGYYTDRHGGGQGFVVTERNGRWGTATRVPGLAALGKVEESEVNSVSCGSAGSCAAGGYYLDRFDHPRVFVASEDNGAWGTAIQVPVLAALGKGGEDTRFPAVSCAPAGTWAAGGYYTDASGHAQGFVVTQTR
jgi:hypothetical protein